MNIAGLGIVFNRGRALQALEKALEEGWVLPQDAAYAVSEDILKDKSALKEMRRADAFSKMACLAAYDAFMDSEVDGEKKRSLGVILTTAFGPYVTTLRFLDDIIHYGDASVSPTIFSHSAHDAAAFYIALALGSRGPTLTITQFAHSFSQGLIIAETWLKSGRCEYVLVGSADVCGEVMKYIYRQKLNVASDGKIKPFSFARAPVAVPGEGSVFFLLTNQETLKKYASISALPEAALKKPDVYILDCDGTTGSEEVYRQIGKAGPLISSYTPIFGSMLTVSSFNCAVAALMLKNQKCYAAPVQDNPHGLNLCTIRKSAKINSISCIRYGCKKERLEIFLKQ